MAKKRIEKENEQAGRIKNKKEKNAGGGAFNQGSEQDPDYDKGVKVSDEEKKTGHKPLRLGKNNIHPESFR